MRTSIEIVGLQSYAYHGLFAEERRLGQKFVFNVKAKLASHATHRDDSLASSIRYDEVLTESARIAQASTFMTLEALGESIASGLLSRFSLMESVVVAVAKVSPPVPESVARVSVEVELTRTELATRCA